MTTKIGAVLAVLSLIWGWEAIQAQSPLPETRRVVFELVTTASGMVYPKEGDILEMRVYEDGAFEYDDYPSPQRARAPVGQVLIVTRQGRISLDELRELVELTRRPDFLEAKAQYRGLRPHIDDRWVTHIRVPADGDEKRIELVNFWDVRSFPEDEAKYPESVVRLLKRSREMKAKALGARWE